MTILFLGNFRVDYCSEVHYEKTLVKLGHTVIGEQESETTGDILIAAAKGYKPDYFFWVHTHSWATPGIDKALAYFKEKGIVTFGYHLDLYMGLSREPQLHEYVTKMDHFFTVDKLMADWLDENTKTKGHYLPAGCFEDESYLAQADRKKYPHEIIFTGSKGYHPEYPYRPQLINWLKKTYGSSFAHYGGGGLPGLRGKELNILYASAKIVIGDTLCKDFNYTYYFSDRLFEVPCRGGFMIFPKIKGIEFMYEVGKEIVLYDYNDFDGLNNLIAHYLHADNEREHIRIAGHIRARGTHTYTNRLKQLLETLEKEKHDTSSLAQSKQG